MTGFITKTWGKLEIWQKILLVIGLVLLTPILIGFLWQVFKFLAIALAVILGVIVICAGGMAFLDGDGGDFGDFG